VFRWYQSETGRYVVVDPVGLDALTRTTIFRRSPNHLYGYVDQRPTLAIDEFGLEVLLCQAPPDVPLLRALGLTHRWLKTDSVEAGLGPRYGGVPGDGEGCDSDCPLTPTSINNHAGEAERRQGATCREVSQIDEECVSRELDIGRPMGPWIPAVNDCWAFVDRIIERCRRKGPRYMDLLPHTL